VTDLSNCLVWVACLRQPRSIEEIKQLTKKDVVDLEPWLSQGMLKEVEGKYLAMFNGWIEALPNTPDRKHLWKDRDLWQELFEHDFTRAAFYDIARVRMLFKFDDDLIDKEGVYYPIFVPLFYSLHAKTSEIPSLIDSAPLIETLLTNKFTKFWHKDLDINWIRSVNFSLDTEKELNSLQWNEVRLKTSMTRYAGLYANIGVQMFDKFQKAVKHANIFTVRRAVNSFMQKLRWR
jgi:hypothetical protein